MRFLNFGSLNLDFVYPVQAFVRPGETISARGLDTFPGGKGLNQSVALCRGGGRVCHAGCIGPDGRVLTDLLSAAGVDVSFVRTLEGERTGHAIIQVDGGGENCILLYGGANRSITLSQVEETLSAFGAGDILLLQNEINLVEEIAAAGKKRGMKVALNPSPTADNLLRLPPDGVDYLILNELEAAFFCGELPPKGALSALSARFPKAKILLTRGTKGMDYLGPEGTFHQPVFPVDAVDTTAAGDTCTGFFLAALARGESPVAAARLAAAASALAVTRKGAAPSIPSLPEVVAFLEGKN